MLSFIVPKYLFFDLSWELNFNIKYLFADLSVKCGFQTGSHPKWNIQTILPLTLMNQYFLIFMFKGVLSELPARCIAASTLKNCNFPYLQAIINRPNK